MKFNHQFTVPTDIQSAWDLLLDLPRVARCMPGASIDAVDGDTFVGSVKVKLGPMQVVYRGSGRFERLSAEDRTAVLSVRAKESRGTGTATARLTVQLAEDGADTKVRAVTDLAITGRPAQLGRGLLEEVSSQLSVRFADSLAGEIRGEDVLALDGHAHRDDALDMGSIGATAMLRWGWPVAGVVLATFAGGYLLWAAARRRARRSCA